MTIDEYAKAVAEAVRAHCEQEARDWDDRAGQAIGNVIAGIRLDAIIASVPRPTAQHHDAPTCGGYTREHAVAELRELTRSAMALLETSDGEKLPAAIRRLGEALIPFAWALDEHESGPLLPPDTTEPASVLLCEKVPHEQRGGYLHAEDDDTPYYVDGLRYCGRCHHFLDEGESHRAAPVPVATPTPDIDP